MVALPDPLYLGRAYSENLALLRQCVEESSSGIHALPRPELPPVRVDLVDFYEDDEDKLALTLELLSFCRVPDLEIVPCRPRFDYTYRGMALLMSALAELLQIPYQRLCIFPKFFFESFGFQNGLQILSALHASDHLESLHLELWGTNVVASDSNLAHMASLDWTVSLLLGAEKTRGPRSLSIHHRTASLFLADLLESNVLRDISLRCTTVDLFDGEDEENVTRRLASNDTLRSLRFDCSRITTDASKAVFRGLAQNKTVTTLSLDCDGCDIAYLARELPAFKGVKELDLVWPRDVDLSGKMMMALYRNKSITKWRGPIPSRARQIVRRNRLWSVIGEVKCLDQPGELPRVLSRIEGVFDAGIMGMEMYCFLRKCLPLFAEHSGGLSASHGTKRKASPWESED